MLRFTPRLISRLALRVTLIGIWLLMDGCSPLARYHLRGTYYRMDDAQPMSINSFEITDTKFRMTLPMGGDIALDYKVEGDAVYLENANAKILFINEGYGILRQEGVLGFDGRFIKLIK